MKHLIMYWWKTWAGWFRDNIIMTTTKKFSANIVCIRRFWEIIWKNASYIGPKELSSQKLTTKRGQSKSNSQKQNTNSVHLLSKAFYINKTSVSHRHQNPLPPNTCITYHVGAASTWNAVMGNTLNHPKWIWGMMLLKVFWTRSYPQQPSVENSWPIKFL